MSLEKTIEMGVKVRMRADRKCHSIHIHSYSILFPLPVTNSMCPRQFHKIMWWEAITFTESGHVTAVQDCPYGAVGKNSKQSSLYHN